MDERVLETHLFHGHSEEYVEDQIHWFLDQPGVTYEAEEMYRENDKSYASVLWYYYVPSEYWLKKDSFNMVDN